MKGVAFKVTYNDGGAGSGMLGFRDTCSTRNILENVMVRRMTNCSREDNACRRFADSHFTGRRPASGQCYESTLLSRKRLQFGSGYYHGETKQGPIPLRGTERDDIAFLTTLLPGCDQSERIIFACFRIGRVYQGDMGHTVKSDGTMDVRLPDAIARQMNFWRYFQNADDSRLWGAGLFRYLTETQTAEALSDLISLLGDHSSRDVILRALEGKVVPKATRRLPVLDATPNTIGSFGGGESPAHLRLKEYVAANPSSVGLPNSAVASIEFPYLSGDQVDIKFDLPGDEAAIVEIETINPLPGAHQCVKYRALLEAAMGYPLGSGRVRAILVAHRFDTATKAFASKYHINLVELFV